MGILKRVVNLFSSFGLAVVVLLGLCLITYLGTVEQVRRPIIDVQRQYFESWYVRHEFAGVPLILPGGTLLMSLLAVNLLMGGMVRIRKNKRTVGILIVHVGMALLLLAGTVKRLLSFDGFLSLHEGERSDIYRSYHDWEVAIHDARAIINAEEHIIPQADFMQLTGDRSRTFTSPELPFDVTLSRYRRNTQAVPGEAAGTRLPARDGVTLLELPHAEEAPANIPGIYVSLKLPGGEVLQGLLWGDERTPWVVQVGEDQTWAIGIRRKEMRMPFTLELEEFRKVDHPGMDLARSFESDVIVMEDAGEREVLIKMNEPLRYEGIVVFQSNWAPADPERGLPATSVFTVVRNPSDKWPEYSCYVIAAGLLIAFGQRLIRWIKRERKKQEALSHA